MQNYKLIIFLLLVSGLLVTTILDRRLNKPLQPSETKNTPVQAIDKYPAGEAVTRHRKNDDDSRLPDLPHEIKVKKQIEMDEIQSLQQSIQNDEKLLISIEKSGTGLADYKWIEANLGKRKKRLEFLKNQK